MKKLVLFILIPAPIIALLYFSLTRDPRTLPSSLLGRQAPDFQLKTLEGEDVVLSHLFGKPIVLNFWSTWCNSCEAEYQLLRQAYEVYSQQGVQFLEILYEDTPEEAQSFIAKQGKAAPILLDPGLKTSINYGVSGVPETFFINKEGTILYKQSGVLTSDILEWQLDRLTRELP